MLAVDFGLAPRERKGILAHFHRYGHVKLPDMITMLSEAGLKAVESGAVGIRDLQYVLAVPDKESLRRTDPNHETA